MMLASTGDMVVEGIHVEDTCIFEPVSLVLSLIISWTFRILAHEEDQYTVFFSLQHSNRLKPGLGVRELSEFGNSNSSYLLYSMFLIVLLNCVEEKQIRKRVQLYSIAT